MQLTFSADKSKKCYYKTQQWMYALREKHNNTYDSYTE